MIQIFDIQIEDHDHEVQRSQLCHRMAFCMPYKVRAHTHTHTIAIGDMHRVTLCLRIIFMINGSDKFISLPANCRTILLFVGREQIG